jgi:hypothetical protein
MSATIFPSSAIGLPASLDYKLPPSLSEDSKSYTVSIAPDGINSVSATALPICPTAANNSTILNPFNSQLVAFTIPSGSSKSVFMDCRETSLNFRLTVQVATAITGGVLASHNVISSAQSFFDSLILYSNNIPVEQINGYNILANQLLMSTVNSAEKFGGCAVAMGCDINTQAGVDLPLATATTTAYYSFSIPLISVIGLNNSDRMFPIGSLSNLQLQMQTAALLPFVSACTTGATAGANQGTMNVTLDQFALNLKYIDIGMDSARLLYSTLNEGKIFMKTATWVQSAVNIPTGSSGQSNLLYQIRNSSLKSLLIQNSQNTSGNCTNGLYDALNLAVTQFNVSVGGIQFPQRPLDPSRKSSESFMYYMAALGYSGDYKKYGGYITRSGYGASIPNTLAAVTAVDSCIVVPANGSRPESGINTGTTQVIAQFPNTHYLGVDFEKSAGILFSGINTRASPPVGNFFINTATNAATTSFAYGLVDCVLVVDTMAQTIQSFV